MAAKHSSMGTQLRVSIATVMTTIPQVVSVNSPGVTRNFESVTALDSVGNFAEYAPLLNDTDEVTAELVWDWLDTTHIYLFNQANLAVAVTDAFKIVYDQITGDPEIAFTAYIASVKPTTQANGLIRATMTLRVTGQPVFTP